MPFVLYVTVRDGNVWENIVCMIQIVQRGQYQLIETKRRIKILVLDNKEAFAWINAGAIGEILVASHRSHRAASLLAVGSYRLYRVSDEPALTDQPHLELSVGNGSWQGYLLPTGLPTNRQGRKRIVPTPEHITAQRICENRGIAWLE